MVLSIVFSPQKKTAEAGDVLVKFWFWLSGHSAVTGSIPPRGPRQAESVTVVFPVGRSESLSPGHQSFSGGVESAELQRRLEPREEGAEKEEA